MTSTSRWIVWTACGLCAVLSGCTPAGRPLDELRTGPAGEGEPYVARVGDSLTIEVWGEPRLTGERLVRDDGRLTMPLINDVPAAGKTLEAIGADISEKLAVYVPTASVSVSVAHSAPIRYYLSGSFQRPGEYRSDTQITLLQAIATGGGFQPFANKGAITLIRKGTDGEKRYVLDHGRVIQGQDPNPILRDGDLISVE